MRGETPDGAFRPGSFRDNEKLKDIAVGKGWMLPEHEESPLSSTGRSRRNEEERILG